MTATITTDKGGGPQVGSMRLTGAEVDAVTPVTFANFDNTGVLGWKWEVIDAPAQSPTLNPLPADVFTATTQLTHDVKGHSILVRLTTYLDVARTIIDDIDQVVLDAQFDPPYDWVIPAAGQSLEVDDVRGWASDVNRILREVNAFMAVGGGGTDADAIHDNVAGEIAALTTVTVAAGDFLLIEDISDANQKKKILASDLLGAALDPNAVHVNASGEIAAVTLKSPVVGADLLLIEDSADANNKKRTTVADLRITESQITDLDHTDADAIHDNVAGEISALTAVTVEDGDHLLIEDDSDANNKKRIPASDFVRTALYGGSGRTLLRRDGGVLSPLTVQPGRLVGVRGLGSTLEDLTYYQIHHILQNSIGAIIDSTTTGTVNDWNPDGNLTNLYRSNAIRWAGGAGLTLNGLQEAQTNEDFAFEKLLINASATQTITINHENGGATAARRFRCPGGVAYVVPPLTAVQLRYDPADDRYIVVGTAVGDSDAVSETLFDANTILKADADDTPAPLTVPEQTLVGRITAGVITALTATQIRTLLNVEDGATAGDADAIHDDVAAEITAIAAKAQAVANDALIAEDSADSDNKKSLTVSALMDSIVTSGGEVVVSGGNVVVAS